MRALIVMTRKTYLRGRTREWGDDYTIVVTR